VNLLKILLRKKNHNSEEELSKINLATQYTRKVGEFDVQDKAIKILLGRIKYFLKKTKGDTHLPIFKSFIKQSLSIISLHTDRVDNYINGLSLGDIETIDLKKKEMDFQNTLYERLSAIEDMLETFNIKDDSTATSGIEFLDKTKAPLSMHGVLSEIYPEINRQLETMKIDFDSSPKNTLLIHDLNPPKWNIEKHYWEQDRDTLQYYVDEFKKIRNGITIDGYYISPWMYYHMNVFVTPVPEVVFNKNSGEMESKDRIKNPPLRDNEVYIFENYNNAKKKQTMMFLAATRRAAKTTLIASHIDHGATIGLKELLVAGGSTKDLGQIAKNFKTSVQYKNPAFAIHNISNDWSKEVVIGIKNKSNKTLLLSTLFIVNLDAGGDKKSEILAGFTPDIFVLDEVMKAPFIDQLDALRPALDGADGQKRCTPILSGTGGNEALSQDALSVLNFPEDNDILPMNWDLLERRVPEEFITWNEDKKKSFGTFLPGQMNVKMVKYKSNLAYYLGVESKFLSQIDINITDWEKSLERINAARDKKSGTKSSLIKEIVYIPIRPSEIFMSGKENPFPVAEAKAHKEHLLRTGLWDRRRMLYRDSQGKAQVELSTKELAPFPHKGGIIDAPCLILQDPPTEKVRYGTYTAGFDDTAADDSDTDSVTTFYVMKNKILGDPFSEKVVASISFRPSRHPLVYEQWLMLMELYQLDGTCFGENVNYAIKDYLDKKHVADKYLAPSLDFTSSFNIPNNLKRKSGWNPTTCKKTLFELTVDYMNEEFEVEDEDGKTITLKGVQKVDDIWLLQEMIEWGENTNVDRLTAFMGANGMLHYLNSSHRWRVPTLEKMKQQKEDKPKRERNFSMYSPPKRPFEQRKR
jgi:hypothetical protein